MGDGIMSALLSNGILQLLVTLLMGGLVFAIGNTIAARRARVAGSKATTTGDLSRLANGLTRSSSELDKILEKIVEVAQNRAEAALRLQAEIQKLEQDEQDYLIQIETLKNEPLRVVNDLLNELHPSQIRTPRHDFMLFFAGVLVSAVISLAWNLLNIGR
jgi:hypothetical protein